jgi:peptidoglycan-associated lipoprotein
MNHASKAVLLLASIGLAACSGSPFNRGGVGAGVAGGAGAYGGGAAPAGTVSPNSVEFFQERVGDRVLFAVDQSTLSDEARGVVAGQARWLMQNPEFAVTIEGHADEQGTREYNLALGARRAASVRDYLVSQGVSESRIRTLTYGKERPLEICSTESCYAKNRRAVTVVGIGATS